MTCKDCLHYNLCKTQYGATNYFDEDGYAVHDVEAYCSNAADKRRFVELPCRVRTVVYIPEEGYITVERVQAFWIDAANILRVVIGGDVRRRASEIGKTIFLTYEEAEQALKEAVEVEE